MERAIRSPERTKPGTRERNGYFDLLRGIALARVVTYHTIGATWLHFAFPAIGVMFALAGSLMAASMAKRSQLAVVGSRLRRLLPPVWLYAIVAIAAGWEVVGTGWRDWSHLLFWVIPLRDPHESPVGSGFVDTLWYLRTYLWFVLLSPVLLWAFRKALAIMLVGPLILLPVLALVGGHGWIGRGLITDTLAYGTCWILGFAEHEGFLQRIAVWACLAGATTAGAGGLALLIVFPAENPTKPDADTVGLALWSAAFVLVLMRWRPGTSWLRRIPWLDRTVTVVNARAVTIYLWHDLAIVATGALLGLVGLHVAGVVELPAVFALTFVAVLAAGWAEDLAALRRPVMLPGGRRAPTVAVPGQRRKTLPQPRPNMPDGTRTLGT